MISLRQFRFVAGERVLGAEPGGCEEREMHYYINDDSVSKLLGNSLSPILADLVEVAAAVHIADRLGVRGRTSPEGWRRRLQVDIPVRCLSDWNRAEVGESLFALLTFLTGDEWDIHFSSRPGSLRTSESQGHLFPVALDQPARVSLFSGGLDALAGTLAAIDRNPDEHLICVSGSPNSRQAHHQKAQMAVLRGTSRGSVTHVRVPCWLDSSDEADQEPTRRTRGFLFLALGAATALNAGGNRLWIYENGVGAINLPYERIPLGVPNSRSVHPETLFLAARFVQALRGRMFAIENPCVFQTKGEMCLLPAVQRFATAIGDTFSCDGFPVQRSKTPQCGVCTSCILRRLALHAASLQDADTMGYACDLYLPNGGINPRRLRGLAAMDWQVERLSTAGKSGWAGLMGEFHELRQACMALMTLTGESSEVIQERLVRLYAAHVAEWRVFPPRHLLVTQRKAA